MFAEAHVSNTVGYMILLSSRGALQRRRLSRGNLQAPLANDPLTTSISAVIDGKEAYVRQMLQPLPAHPNRY